MEGKEILDIPTHLHREAEDVSSVSVLEGQSVKITCESDKCDTVKSKCS